MANTSIRNLLSFLQKKCLLKTFATLTSPPPPMPTITNAAAATSSSTFTVQYLINSCGLTLKSALSVSRKLQLHENKIKKAQLVLNFLKSHDFNNTQIAKLIEKRPDALLWKVKNNLKPKFDLLITNGFEGQLLHELIISNPTILRMALATHLKPCFELLRLFLYSNEKIVAAVKSCSWLLTFDLKRIMQPNVDFLIKEGVPFNCIARLFLKNPRSVMQKHDRMVYVVNAVKNLGLQPNAPMFIHGVTVRLSMSESTWKKKLEVMRSFGCSEEQILETFKTYPFCLACSEEKLRGAMNFYLNTMNLSAETVISYPLFLMYSIDKRIRPRHNVLKVLKSRKLINEDMKMKWLLLISEKEFFEKYVKKYVDQVPGLLEIYEVPRRQKS